MWRHLLSVGKTLFPATAVSDWTTVMSTHCKQNVSPRSKQTVMCNGVADSLIGIQLLLAVVQPSRWFANRCVCAVPSSVRMTTNNTQIYSWVGYTSRENRSLHRLKSVSQTAVTIEANKIYGVCLACIRLDEKNTCHVLLFVSWAWYDWNSPLMFIDCWLTIKLHRAHL